MLELYKNCTLCPRACGVDRTAGQLGFCGASAQPTASRAALHFWEEPCISGTRGSGAVFFNHCTLQCVFCQNRAISGRDTGHDRIVTTNGLCQTFLDLQSQGAHNINLVTPSHYAPHIIAALERARMHGLSIPVVYNCGGYESVSALRRLTGLVDIYLPDFKYYSSYYAERYSAAPSYHETALEAIAEMLRQTGAPQFDENGLMRHGVIIRHLMLPTLAGDTAQVLRDIAAHFGDLVMVSLMRQYTPFGMQRWPELNRKITDFEYQDACEQFLLLGLKGFFQEKESVSESFIPAFDGSGLS